MPKLDPSDAGFTDTIERMLGIDRDEIAKRLEELDADALIDLTDAVAKRDRRAAEKILGPAQRPKETAPVPAPTKVEINPLLAPEEPQRAKVRKPGERARKEDAAETNESAGDLEIGEEVMVGDKTATVKIPSAPGGTVGVIVDGALKMVPRRDVSTVTEGLEQFAALPDLGRMLALAGMQSDLTPAPVAMPAMLPTQEIAVPASDAGAAECPETAVAEANAALDRLEQAMPGVRQAEVRRLRRRLNDLIARLNESATRRPR